ncbi:hypothetical protein [Alloprevotella sp. OH1205_COT-284]|uniref:hypothetical protein n=1 Tax=Alloprevotella sp. OH1205_COT-284 TaxID=2491043 RepID=UPI0013154853|nr:hypothetical protein [Alloprevotella sp. OH1205_COT-284]
MKRYIAPTFQYTAVHLEGIIAGSTGEKPPSLKISSTFEETPDILWGGEGNAAEGV